MYNSIYNKVGVQPLKATSQCVVFISIYHMYTSMIISSYRLNKGKQKNMAKLKNPKDVFKLLVVSKQFMLEHTANFAENERLKAGLPKTGIPSNYPRVTDKTLSKKINDTPKRVFQKLPEFTVDTGADKFTDICVEYILNKECIEGADDGYSWYQRLINAGRDAGGFGVCAVYSPFELVDGSYRVGFVPIYWGDLFLEAYTTNVNVANYNFIRQWKTKADMDAILDNDDPDVDDGWDRTEVKDLVDKHATTPVDNTNNTRVSTSSELYEVYTYISKDEFITFSIANGDKVLRGKDNKSKRRRVVGLYYDFDGVNPLGRSMVDIGGDLQNLIDSDMQAYQFNRALALQPPVFISGDIDSGDGIFMPNNVMVVDDPMTAGKALEISTTAIENYPQLYALQISQLNALIPDADNTSISSADNGGVSSSKTSTGIKQNQQTQNISDNFFFKNGEAFLSTWAENALNIYMGEFTGVIELQLDNEYADKARAENPEGVSPTGLVHLDCSVVTKIRVKVDSGSTRDVAREEDNQRLSGLMNMEGQSPIVAQTIGSEGTKEIVKSMVKSSGVSNAGDIMEAIDNNPAPDPSQVGPDGQPVQPQQPDQSQQVDPNAEASGQMNLMAQAQKMKQDAEMHQAKLQQMRSVPNVSAASR